MKALHDHEHLATLQRYYAQHRVLPSYARLMEILGYASKSAVKKVLERLETAGMLERTPDGDWAPTERFFERVVANEPVPAGMPVTTLDDGVEQMTIDRPLTFLRAMADHAGFKLSPILQQVSVPISSPIPQPLPDPLPEPLPATPPTLTVISSDATTPLRSESSVSSTLSWYLVHTKPRQEDVALANLERQGYECYLPQMRIERIRRRKAEVTTEPMFPRYLFIRLDISDQGKSWSPIRSTLGVSQLVHFGAQAAKVDDNLVDLLRQRERALPTEAMFHSGDSVVITDGPFAGIEAIFQTADAERRAFILLEILAKPVSMQIDAGRLRKAG